MLFNTFGSYTEHNRWMNDLVNVNLSYFSLNIAQLETQVRRNILTASQVRKCQTVQSETVNFAMFLRGHCIVPGMNTVHGLQPGTIC